MKRKFLYSLLAIASLTIGCINDDISQCRLGVGIQYSYTKNNSGTNKFTTDVNKISLYIFDKDSLYLGSVVEQGEHLTNDYIHYVLLPREGVYNFVAWGAGDEMEDYEIVQKTANGYDKNFTVGVTRMSDMRKRVVETKNGVLETEIDDVFYGIAHNVEVKGTSAYTRTNIELMKNTNTIYLTLSGFSSTTYATFMGEIDANLTAMGGVYQFDNKLDKASSLPYIYKPYDNRVESTSLSFSLKTLRLLTTRPMMLTLKDTDSGAVILSATDLVKLIRKNPNYTTQDDLDTEDVYNITITKDVNVTININGWTIIDTDIEIQK